MPAIIAEGETGWLSAPGDATAFAADVDFALDHDLTAMRLAARAHALKFHDIGTASVLLEKTLRKLVAA